MKLVARVKELVVEGRASFSAEQFEERLAELLEQSELEGAELEDLVLQELVVDAAPGLPAAARATAQALRAQLRRSRS